MQGNGIGEAYKLIHVNNGRSIKSLVSGDRLKLYEVDKRGEFSGRLPGVQAPSEIKPAKDRNGGFEPAVKILRQRMKDNKREYLVQFKDNSCWWCLDVTPALFQQYELKQANRRRRK